MVLRVRRGDDDGVDVVAADRVLPAILDHAGAPCRTGRFRGRERSAREHGDLGARRPQRRKVDVVGGGAAADDRESNGHARCCSATLRTAYATSSQSASVYATPTGTMTERPTSASVCGHRPGPYARSVGCSARRRPVRRRAPRARPGSGTRAARGTSARTGRLRRAGAAANRLAVVASRQEPRDARAAVAVGIGAAASHQARRLADRVEDPRLVRSQRARISGRRRAARPRPRRRARPCAGSRPRTAR